MIKDCEKSCLKYSQAGGYAGKAWDPIRLGPAYSSSKDKGGSDPTFPPEEHRRTRTRPPSFLAEQKKQKKKQKKKKKKKKKKEEKKEEKEEKEKKNKKKKKKKKKKRKAPIELD